MKGKRLFSFNLRMVCSRSDNHETLEKSLESQWLPPALCVKCVRSSGTWHSEEKRDN